MCRNLFPAHRRQQCTANPTIEHRYRRLLALYKASNTVFHQHTIWSWKDFGSKR